MTKKQVLVLDEKSDELRRLLESEDKGEQERLLREVFKPPAIIEIEDNTEAEPEE